MYKISILKKCYLQSFSPDNGKQYKKYYSHVLGTSTNPIHQKKKKLILEFKSTTYLIKQSIHKKDIEHPSAFPKIIAKKYF